MKLVFGISLTLLATFPNCYCAPTNSETKSLAENYSALTDDVKWFLRGTSKVASALERMLPNVTTDMVKTRQLPENARVTFLIGLRHLLVGVREIAITFEQNFNTDHVEQLHQLRYVTEFINQLVAAMNIWFDKMHSLATQLLHLYNRYIPEVLFGKCLGNYLVANYPERSYYEYPFILLTEIYMSITTRGDYPTEPANESPSVDSEVNVEQNEISHADLVEYKTPYATRLPSQSDESSTESFADTESIFDLTTVLSENKDEIIESAGNRRSWQICLKLYTAETISRSLTEYFLEWDEEEDEEISESESVLDYEINQRNGSSTNLHEGDKLASEIVEAIKSLGLVDKLWQRAQPLENSLLQLLRESNIGLVMKAKNLNISSLICLQNLCNCLSSEDLGGHNAIYSVWVDLGQQVFKGPKDTSILEPSTSLMRAALEHLKSKKELFDQMTQNDLEAISCISCISF